MTPAEAEALKRIKATAQAGRIEMAPQTMLHGARGQSGQDIVAKILTIVGYPGALVSDESTLHDFLFATMDGNVETLDALSATFKKPFDRAHLYMRFKALVQYIRAP